MEHKVTGCIDCPFVQSNAGGDYGSFPNSCVINNIVIDDYLGKDDPAPPDCPLRKDSLTITLIKDE